jgi:hypothetical protein
MSTGPWIDAKMTKPPEEDGKTLLFLARLNTDGEPVVPVVGVWRTYNGDWRLILNDTGTALIPFYWMEIPELPG